MPEILDLIMDFSMPTTSIFKNDDLVMIWEKF